MLARILGSPWLGRTVRSRNNKRMVEAAERAIQGGPVD